MGTLPIEDKGKEEVKRTNEIKTAIPLLEAIDIAGKDVSGDALLTQRELADYLVGTRKAHYYFTVKGNQPGLLEALEFYFRDRGQPHFVEHTPPDHGRIETRKIWTTTELNRYTRFSSCGPRNSYRAAPHGQKRAARALWKFLTASPAALGNKPARNACSRSTVGIG